MTQTSAQPSTAPRVGLWGVLLEDARTYTSCSGVQHLQVVIAQHLPQQRDACPVKATFHYPDTGTPNATAMVATRAAADLRRGVEVLVTGEGLHPHHHNGKPAMALGRVHSIRPVAQHIAPPYHAPTGDH